MVKEVKTTVPDAGHLDLQTLHGLREKSDLVFGDSRTVTFLNNISKMLLTPNVRRSNPEFASLGYFLRSANVNSLIEEARAKNDYQLVPRGLVFHVPPANVDTVFMYSWALSLLAGNSNVVRVSHRAGDKTKQLIQIIAESVSNSDAIFSQTQYFVEYGRDDAISEMLSIACDLRVIWGGDETVSILRRFPLRPLARDITFPNRTSFSVVNINEWMSQDDLKISDLGDGFVRDIYWFDQAACSSPRMIFAIGNEVLVDKFIASLGMSINQSLEQRNINQDASVLMEKTVRTHVTVAAGLSSSVSSFRNRSFVATRGSNGNIRSWCGVGAVTVTHCESLSEVKQHVLRTDQTMTYFGFSQGELTDFTVSTGQRGIDRIVPIGTALDFSHIWDGMNLLTEYSRQVAIN